MLICAGLLCLLHTCTHIIGYTSTEKEEPAHLTKGDDDEKEIEAYEDSNGEVVCY